MQDSPDASQLLGAIAEALEKEVLEGADVSAQHQVRVAANLCRIVQREVVLAADTDQVAREQLARLLGHDGPSEELWRELATRLQASSNAEREDEPAVHAALLAIVRGKLAVAKPGYDAYDFDLERP